MQRFKVGDTVRCPSGKFAKVLGIAPDGKISARYCGRNFADGDVFLDARHVEAVEYAGGVATRRLIYGHLLSDSNDD